MRPPNFYEWDGISMTTHQRRAGGIYQQLEKAPSPAALGYMSALVWGEWRVCPVLSQEHLRKKKSSGQ